MKSISTSKPSVSKKPTKATFNKKRLPIGLLLPHPKNPRVHPEPDSPEWAALKRSMAHDYFDPVVWNKRNGLLVSGHLRVKIMSASGVAEVDVVEVDYDEPTHVARMIAANRSSGQTDLDLQKELLEGLAGLASFDIGLTGIGVAELTSDFDLELGGGPIFEYSSNEPDPTPAPTPSAAPTRSPGLSPTIPSPEPSDAVDASVAPTGPLPPSPPTAPAQLQPVITSTIPLLLTEDQSKEYQNLIEVLRGRGYSDSELVIQGLKFLVANPPKTTN